MNALDIVLFGGTGDLSMRKLMPALYHLFRAGGLPEGSRILAISRGVMKREAFRDMVHDRLETFLDKGALDEALWLKFRDMLDYQNMDLTRAGDWKRLSAWLSPVGGRDIIYYLAVPPTLFGPVCEQIKTHGLNPDASRLVVEKPLGEDCKSAAAVNDRLAAAFAEEQIYRIDHYLGKEAVQNLLVLRFGNRLMDAVWNREHIDYVEITVAETVGVEGRGEFLDRAGLLRDMIQNHLMQILCLIAMAPPESLAADDVREGKLAVVKSFRPVTRDNIRDHVVRGQYTAGEGLPGYLEELRQAGGQTAGTGETFVALKVLIDNDQWRGVPFYLRTGKRLRRRFAEIVVQLKPAALFGTSRNNRILIQLQPDMQVSLDLIMKQMLLDEMALMPHRMVTHLDRGENRIPDAYEKLLGDVIRRKQTYFVSHDEIMASWAWIDGIRRAWTEAELAMETYAAGTMGPAGSNRLLAGSGHSWHNHEEGL